MPKRKEANDRVNDGKNDSVIEIESRVFPGGTTGRFLVVMKEGATEAGVRSLRDRLGIGVTSAAESIDAGEDISNRDIIFDTFGVAVVSAPPAELYGVAAESTGTPFLHIEPERYVYALGTAPARRPVPVTAGPSLGRETMPVPADYLRGYRDAVNEVVGRVLFENGQGVRTLAEAEPVWDESQSTWGLQATRVPTSRFSGRQIGVAVLDTGFDLSHPDFQGRQIKVRSFVPGQPVQDGHGHGTHCTGTAAGPLQGSQPPRYGVAYAADVFAGKVLNNQGSGTDSQILAGIEWAILNKCAVISMSLGAPVEVGVPWSRVFEQVARRALNNDALIVAAAGNDSHRPGSIVPVSHPANCPSIMAVGALTQMLKPAWFSNGGLNTDGGQVDIAAPGVAVRSSWPVPTLYRTLDGTSMATPHVAGIAALLAEARPNARGLELWALVVQHARHLTVPNRDVGAGIAQAPQ